MVTVKIENAYSDGHESERTVEVENPPSGASLSAWFEIHVYPHTGDGHGTDSGLGSFYVATIISADESNLIGATYEWMD